VRILYTFNTYSIPVYGTDSHDIVGLILTKDLIFIDPEDETPVKNFVHIFGRQLQYVWPTQSLGEVLKMFKQGHGHMAIVRDTVDDGQVYLPSPATAIAIAIVTSRVLFWKAHCIVSKLFECNYCSLVVC
jgi:hypothetical protein